MSQKKKTIQGENLSSPSKSRINFKLILGVVLVMILIVMPMIITMTLFRQVFDERAYIPEVSSLFRYEDVEGYPRRITHFPSGSNRLTAYIYGEENTQGLVVISHGLGGGAESYFPETMFFVDYGWRVFAFDNTGSHNSEGAGLRGLPQSVRDLEAALDYINTQDWGLPIVLFGHSWGGYAVTTILDRDYDISAVVSMAGFNSPLGMMHEANRGLGFLSGLAYPYLWAYQRILFGSDAARTAVAGINNTDIPVMIIHGTEDDVVLYDGASIIAQMGRITNPNVIAISRSAQDQNGHNNLLRDLSAMPMINELNQLWGAAIREHDGVVPTDVRDELFAWIRPYASALDPELMNRINEFFLDSIS